MKNKDEIMKMLKEFKEKKFNNLSPDAKCDIEYIIEFIEKSL